MQLNCMEYLNTHQINLIEKIESYEDAIFAQNHLSYEERLSSMHVYTVQSLYKSISHHWNSEESEMTICIQDFKLSGPNLIQSIDLEEVVIPYAKKP